MKWERLETEHAESVFRTPVYGGWLIKIVLEKIIQIPIIEPTSNGATGTFRNETGYEWTGSVAFMPDPEHKWNPKIDYQKRSQEKETLTQDYLATLNK